MPTAETTYRNLLADVLPSVVETERQYETLRHRLTDLVRKGAKRSAGETKLLRLLALLLEDYDARHRLPSETSTPAERLRYVLERSGKTAEDIAAIFGGRSHVSEALNGRRPISAEQARRLAEVFSVKPGLFV